MTPLFYFLAGLTLLGSTLMLFRWIAVSDAAVIAARIRQFGWFAVIGLMAVASFRFPGFALFLIPALIPVLRRALRGQNAFRKPSQTRTSEVETDYLSVELDHDTGAMNGMVKRGVFSGRPLDALERQDCDALALVLATEDRDGLTVFAEYYQRRFGEPLDADAFRDETASSEAPPHHDEPMDAKAAADLLGVPVNADRDTVNRAYRQAMKTAHPDRGGSPELAAKLNRARDLLL